MLLKVIHANKLYSHGHKSKSPIQFWDIPISNAIVPFFPI